MQAVRRAVRRVVGEGLVHQVQDAVKWHRYCRGVYATFAEAKNSIPHGRIGYDNEASTQLYLNRLEETKISDYAAFYWLRPLLDEIRGVLDFGGNLGWSYYSFQKYLTFPDHLRWIILDVPAVMRAGEQLAKERAARHLSFTGEMSTVESCDVFYTSGTLQYVEEGLSDMLAPVERKPRHVFVNRVPFTDSPTYYTIQDIGSAYCPYRIENRRGFIESLEKLGYRLVDQWRCPETWCSVLLRPSRHVPFYSGMYFQLASPVG